MSIDELKEKILNIRSGKSHYFFTNTVGQSWYFSRANIKTALLLYDPNSFNGKIAKLAMLSKRIPLLLRKAKISDVDIKLKNDLYNKLCDIFNITDFDFSVFLGSPCLNQKITLQINQGVKVLGYCKISDRNNNVILFNKEVSVLEYLSNSDFNHTPKVMYCGDFRDSITLFAQTTRRSIHSFATIDRSYILKFLKELSIKTKQEILFQDSDFYQTINELSEKLSAFSEKNRNVIEQTLQMLMDEWKDKKVGFCLYHGDFTKWNSFVETKTLYAFDLEYAKRTYPVFMDYFHFYTQLFMYEIKSGKSIYEMVRKEYIHLDGIVNKPDLIYCAYLIEVINTYSGGFIKSIEKTNENIAIWVDIISTILGNRNYI